jgi:hypothetical protein
MYQKQCEIDSVRAELYQKQCEIDSVRAELYQKQCEIDRLVAAASHPVMPAAPPDDRFLAALNNIMGCGSGTDNGDDECLADASDAVPASTSAPEATLESILTALAKCAPSQM